MENKIIGIMGNIATGKTTLSTNLGKALESNVYLEDATLCPYLAKFYSEQMALAFQAKMWFLDYRFGVYLNALGQKKIQVIDGTPWDDLAHASVSLEDDDYDLYVRWFKKITAIVRCDILIFLSAATSTLLNRILIRERAAEQLMAPQDLLTLVTKLEASYERVVSEIPVQNVIRLDTDQVNVSVEADIDALVQRLLQ